MAFSSGLSPQMKMLSPAQQQAILDDYAQSPDASGGVPTINMLSAGRQVSGPVFEGDAPATDATVGPLTRAQVQSMVPQESQPVQPHQETQGALSQVAPQREQPVDIAEMLRQYMPQDNSQSRYLALAAGFAAPTRTGSFGEQLGNVASAMQQQRSEQDKLRSQYVPLIMQQVAAQQAREEQAAYRLEAQQQAQAAQAEAARQKKIADVEAARLAAIRRTDDLNMMRDAADERARAERALRESLAADRLAATESARVAKAAELAGTEPEAPTPILGVPVPRVLPWANQSNAKNADKVRASEFARGSKEAEADADAAKQAAEAAKEAARFQTLNAKTGTGGLSDRIPGGQFVQSFGDDYNEMQAITARLAPSMRQAGSGATSDFDAKMFQRGTVGVDKPKSVNDAIAIGLVTRAKNAQDYADFRSTYLEQNGTLSGASEHWNKYIAANPIFDPKSPASPVINENRVQWRDYFGKTTGQAAPTAAPKPSPAGSPATKTVSWGDLK